MGWHEDNKILFHVCGSCIAILWQRALYVATFFFPPPETLRQMNRFRNQAKILVGKMTPHGSIY